MLIVACLFAGAGFLLVLGLHLDAEGGTGTEFVYGGAVVAGILGLLGLMDLHSIHSASPPPADDDSGGAR